MKWSALEIAVPWLRSLTDPLSEAMIRARVGATAALMAVDMQEEEIGPGIFDVPGPMSGTDEGGTVRLPECYPRPGYVNAVWQRYWDERK